jgi:hypothetical protein
MQPSKTTQPPNKSSQINALPAASRKHHEQFNLQPDFGARPRQGVTGLRRSAY